MEIPGSHVHSPNLKRNGWILLYLGPLVLSGSRNFPIFASPFLDKIWNLGHYHLVDNITKEKPAKFQIKWTAGSKVLRLCNFGAPKGPKSGPNLTERTVGPKNGPCPKPLFSDGNWNFGRCQSGDIFQAAELPKYQIRPTPCPKVMGIGILGPKKGRRPKSTISRP